jgi:hypothetical protein
MMRSARVVLRFLFCGAMCTVTLCLGPVKRLSMRSSLGKDALVDQSLFDEVLIGRNIFARWRCQLVRQRRTLRLFDCLVVRRNAARLGLDFWLGPAPTVAR